MKKKTKKTLIRVIAVILAMLMPMSTAVAFAAAGDGGSGSEAGGNSAIAEKYANPDINEISGHGEEPEELSVSAGATYQEKAWYEYITYSENAVASYRLNDDYRILFYDPYTYTNSMIMDVQFDATTTEYDTMSSYTVSNTKSKTISACVESTYSQTGATQTSGRDLTHTDITNSGKLKTEYNHSVVNSTTGTVTDETVYTYHKEHTLTETLTTGIKAGVETTVGGPANTGVTIVADESLDVTIGHHIQWLNDKQTNTTVYSDDYSTSTNYVGTDTVTDNTSSVTDGWTELSARVTKTIGSSSSTSNSWSESESATVTKTYAATHFASDGVTPLPWAIVHYSVQMPMKCCLQVKYRGEWVTVSTVYCLLTTIKGTCRAWIQNGQTYYEDWGSGEPVVATDFWSQFMTKDQLMTAYQNKLYPVGGDD